MPAEVANETEQLARMIRELEAEEIRNAREMPPIDKLAAAEEMYECASWLMAEGFRNRFPNANDDEIRKMVAAQFAHNHSDNDEV